nr:unnamed protein product [Spirometra erinaceieuropaei]
MLISILAHLVDANHRIYSKEAFQIVCRTPANVSKGPTQTGAIYSTSSGCTASESSAMPSEDVDTGFLSSVANADPGWLSRVTPTPDYSAVYSTYSTYKQPYSQPMSPQLTPMTTTRGPRHARQLRGDMIQTFRIVRGLDCALRRDDFFQLATTTHLRGHTFKLLVPQGRLNVRKYFFSSRVVEPWNNLPETVFMSQSVETFKCRLERYMLQQQADYVTF